MSGGGGRVHSVNRGSDPHRAYSRENMSFLAQSWGGVHDAVSPDRATALAWGTIAAFAIVDLVWLPFSRLTLAPNTAWELCKTGLLIAVCACIPSVVRYRLAADRSPTSLFIRRMGSSLDLLVMAAVIILPWCFFGAIFEYLATSAGLPLLDSWLAALDKFLGFDWPWLVALANSNRAVSAVLVFAYRTTGPVVVATVVILALFNDRIRLTELLALLTMSSLLGGILMAFVPAAGAYAYYAPAPEVFSNFTAVGGLLHLKTFNSLRHDEAQVLDLTKTIGLVTFPSFHTVLAIITTYALRKLRLLFWSVAILNTLVIVSTLPEGGHHFADVIAGLLVATLSIAVVRAVSESPRRLAWLSRSPAVSTMVATARPPDRRADPPEPRMPR